jgi:hypothetical protein
MWRSKQLISRGQGVVFRNSAGTIIGGDLGNAAGTLCYSPTGNQSAEVSDTPDGVDPSRTTVSVYCDVRPRDSDTAN